MTWKGHLFGREGNNRIAEQRELDGQGQDNDIHWSARIIGSASRTSTVPSASPTARVTFKSKHAKLAIKLISAGRRHLPQQGESRPLRRHRPRRHPYFSARPSPPTSYHPPTPHSPSCSKTPTAPIAPYRPLQPALHPCYRRDRQTRVRNTPYTFLRDSTLSLTSSCQSGPWVLREILHNCIAIRTTRCGRVSVVEREDSLTPSSNPGAFIPGTVFERDQSRLAARPLSATASSLPP